MKITRPQIEALYKEFYPRKMGKNDGIKSGLRQIKTLADYADLKTAILNYRHYLAREKKEAQYVLYFSTFMNQWKDWLDPLHGQSEDFSVEPKQDLGDIFK